MKHQLRCIHRGGNIAGNPKGPDIRVESEIEVLGGSKLIAGFTVWTKDRHVNPGWPRSQSQWGLWDFDVVELFVHPGGNPKGVPYYEFQMSPLGQYFELEIFEPRQRVNREYRSGGSFTARDYGDRWTAQMEIPLARLGVRDATCTMTGNVFAILGREPRSYWSAFLGPQSVPDFHLPGAFAPLFK